MIGRTTWLSEYLNEDLALGEASRYGERPGETITESARDPGENDLRCIESDRFRERGDDWRSATGSFAPSSFFSRCRSECKTWKAV